MPTISSTVSLSDSVEGKSLLIMRSLTVWTARALQGSGL